ncbi:MAG TPA: peptidylprolyl isomerase [bacterium]|nr:peptidylprolyl isomerase [bacterium]HOL47251.1 peptidylprolyl isomerase [bacterium]HPQ19287.1 peptidylprolyl isomerase [bacterium]
MQKYFFVSFFIFLFSLFSFASIEDVVVAIVHNKPILKSEVLDAYEKLGWTTISENDLKQRLNRQLIVDLIKDKLLKVEAEELKIEIPENAIEENANQELRNIIERAGGENKLIDELLKEGMSYDDFKKELKESIKDLMIKQQLFNMKVLSKIVVTDREALFRYDVSLILVKDYDKAKQIIEDLKVNKKNFEELAIEFSEGPKAKEGGNLGFIKLGDLQTDVEKELIELDENGISSIVPTKYGFTIIKLNKKERIDEKSISKEELNEIKERLFQIKSIAGEQKLYLELWNKYSITINYDILDNI